MSNLDNGPTVQKKVKGAKGAINTFTLLILMIVLAAFGTWAGLGLRMPFLDTVYSLIGLSDSDLHNGQSNKPLPPPEPLNMN